MPRPRTTTRTERGFISIPRDVSFVGWKIIIIATDGTEHNVTDDLDGQFKLERIATDGLSNFNFIIDNTEGKYKDKFTAGNKVNFYYDFKKFSEQNILRFRGYIDNAFDEVHGGSFTISIEGRDAPPSSTNEHFADTDITIKFVSINILDCWLGTTVTETEPVDGEGNFPDGVLYNSGLIMKIFDTSDNTFKNYKDLSDEQKTTLKAQTGYTSVHSDTHVEKSRLTISKIMADEGDYEFRIFYDTSDDKSYLYIHPSGAILNSKESVVLGQNFIDLGRFGKDTLTEANRFKQKGFSDGEILLMRTKEDTERQSALWIKDKVETSSAIKTTDELDARATARLNQFKDVGKSGTLISDGLPTLQPAEKFRLLLPYVISENVISKSFTITGGPGVGLEFTHNLLTREATMQQLFKDRIKENEGVVPSDNENGHRNVFLFDFSNINDYVLGKSEIVNEVLSIVNGSSEGFCTTVNKTADNNVIKIELRVKGNQLLKSIYRVRNTNNDLDWITIAPNTSITLSSTGKNVQLEIKLIQSTSGVNPEFNKAELLYTEE